MQSSDLTKFKFAANIAGPYCSACCSGGGGGVGPAGPPGPTGPTGPSGGGGAPTTWAQYPATTNVDISCNLIYDVSAIRFCDQTYIGPGGSFDISSNDTIKIMTGGGSMISVGATGITATAATINLNGNITSPIAMAGTSPSIIYDAGPVSYPFTDLSPFFANFWRITITSTSGFYNGQSVTLSGCSDPTKDGVVTIGNVSSPTELWLTGILTPYLGTPVSGNVDAFSSHTLIGGQSNGWSIANGTIVTGGGTMTIKAQDSSATPSATLTQAGSLVLGDYNAGKGELKLLNNAYAPMLRIGEDTNYLNSQYAVIENQIVGRSLTVRSQTNDGYCRMNMDAYSKTVSFGVNNAVVGVSAVADLPNNTFSIYNTGAITAEFSGGNITFTTPSILLGGITTYNTTAGVQTTVQADVDNLDQVLTNNAYVPMTWYKRDTSFTINPAVSLAFDTDDFVWRYSGLWGITNGDSRYCGALRFQIDVNISAEDLDHTIVWWVRLFNNSNSATYYSTDFQDERFGFITTRENNPVNGNRYHQVSFSSTFDLDPSSTGQPVPVDGNSLKIEVFGWANNVATTPRAQVSATIRPLRNLV